MSRATLGGSRVVAGRGRTAIPGGVAGPQRYRFDHLMAAGRPAWADDPTLDLPCQRPDSDPDWWFAAGTGREERAIREHAQRLCLTCPMWRECRDHAVAAPRELYGIWGGVLMERPGRPSPTQRKGAGS